MPGLPDRRTGKSDYAPEKRAKSPATGRTRPAKRALGKTLKIQYIDKNCLYYTLYSCIYRYGPVYLPYSMEQMHWFLGVWCICLSGRLVRNRLCLNCVWSQLHRSSKLVALICAGGGKSQPESHLFIPESHLFIPESLLFILVFSYICTQPAFLARLGYPWIYLSIFQYNFYRFQCNFYRL